MTSRAEKKLAKLKAQEELKKLKEEKKEQNKKANQGKEWYQYGWGLLVAILFFPYFLVWYTWAKSKWSKNVKIAVTVVVSIIMLPFFIGIMSAPTNSPQGSNQASEAPAVQETKKEESKTAKELMLENINGLIGTKEAFDTGSYVKGDIPAGEYAFMPFAGSGKYYSEEDSAGNIIDNENFDSFGYVHVQGAGNIQTQGVLIKVDVFEKLGVKSAKEIYEKLNDATDYKDSAMYKVGVDIVPGTYTVESYGQGYVEVMSGPVGNSDIVDNEIFNGKYSVSVSAGQYLKVSKGKLL